MFGYLVGFRDSMFASNKLGENPMSRNRYSLLSITVLLAAMMQVSADDRPDLKEIMRGLLVDSNEIFESLLIEDFDKVSSAAARIANHPQISPVQVELVAAELGAEMPAFKKFDTQVHELSLSIVQAAEEGDRNGAIADYHQMLDGCFACHVAYKDRITAVLSREPVPE